jgi:hypothetical protein
MDHEDAASDRDVIVFPDQAQPVFDHFDDDLLDLVDADHLGHRHLPGDPSWIVDQGVTLRLKDVTQGGRGARGKGVPSG